MSMGQRVAEARTEAGLTQEQLASAIGLDRSSLAKIETGTRRLAATELVAIARELRRRIEWFVDPRTPSVVSYRAAHPDVATQDIDRELERLAHDVEFVAAQVPDLVIRQAERPAPESMAAADALAGYARELMGLSPDEPAHELSRHVARLGLMAFSLRLGEGADAGTVLLDTGGVTVVNGDLHVGRRRLALAHELGHYLIADPYTLDWRVAADSDRLEGRLDRFARSVLLPEADLRARWHRWRDRPGERLRDAAVRAASHYRVDMATLARRLGEIDLVEASAADEIRGVRTRRADIVEKDLVVHDELKPVSLPRPYEQAVLRLYRREYVTADRALDLLLGTFEKDALPDLPTVAESEIWTVTS